MEQTTPVAERWLRFQYGNVHDQLQMWMKDLPIQDTIEDEKMDKILKFLAGYLSFENWNRIEDALPTLTDHRTENEIKETKESIIRILIEAFSAKEVIEMCSKVKYWLV
ncbi:hypothetical protein TSTA_110680 [Talaromyces stipitatus ATCC 10500]|uniref:Uncharacterized protein n=1 Tax=Talaromyces stipitatus (strain ATCC 10500 / CBS 375.48 / QM 6759 / NRRL 1006) TaxID=441959 RepID=B8MUZ9_TALSN|nr:uncharacterized protein TSTA_110680 [Talaromyces stipitatus ATCC 10500]EED11889.1 hypothetical protein TSTA_110680 [Talaromyces stipitatus ATCC 10500]